MGTGTGSGLRLDSREGGNGAGTRSMVKKGKGCQWHCDILQRLLLEAGRGKRRLPALNALSSAKPIDSRPSQSEWRRCLTYQHQHHLQPWHRHIWPSSAETIACSPPPSRLGSSVGGGLHVAPGRRCTGTLLCSRSLPTAGQDTTGHWPPGQYVLDASLSVPLSFRL